MEPGRLSAQRAAGIATAELPQQGPAALPQQVLAALPPGAQAALLPDGRRLHLQHGPIDLVIEAFGEPEAVTVAYRLAITRFATVLGELVEELPILRAPILCTPLLHASLGAEPPMVHGAVARRMLEACRPHARVFVTPMAAVAGAVADEVLAAMLPPGHGLRRAYVNDGGDIALHLEPGERLTAGLVARLDRPAIVARAEISSEMPVRGVATSGRGGRSFSLGIADAVSVLAQTAAAADAAATLIANAVSLDNPAVRRRPASELKPDTDLGDLPVVVAVGPLPLHDVEAALDAGLAEAERMRADGLIEGAWLGLRGLSRTTGLERLLRRPDPSTELPKGRPPDPPLGRTASHDDRGTTRRRG